MNLRLSSLHGIVLALLAGAALPFSFAPFNLYLTALLSPAILLYLWLLASPRVAFWQGLSFGAGFFGLGVSWVYLSIHHYGNASIALALLITALFVLVLALFFGITGYCFSRFFKTSSLPIQCLCIFPALWVTNEWCRTWVGTGFPWLFLGYSQTTSLLGSYAPLFGVYGISLIVSIVSGAIVLVSLNTTRKIKYFALLVISIVFGAAASLATQHWTTPQDKPITVSLVQGNVPQELKWDPQMLPVILKRYQSTIQQEAKSDILVWPEAAIPAYPHTIEYFMKAIDEEAKAEQTALLVGAPLYEPGSKASFNSLIFLGAQHATYLKRHLVPFGEYIPLQSLFSPIMAHFNIPMSGFTSGPEDQGRFETGKAIIAPFICYEIAYPAEVLENLNEAELILVISDDSWFGNSMASPQQLQIAQLRARETGRPILYSTNTGITAIIDSSGTIQQRLPVDQQGILTAQVTAMKGATPLMRWHYYPVLILVLLFLGLGVWRRKKA